MSGKPANKVPDKAGVGTRVVETDSPTPRVDAGQDLRAEPWVAYAAKATMVSCLQELQPR